MLNISEFLKKFSGFGKDNIETINIFKKISLSAGIDLGNYQITYKNKTIKVDCPHTIKNLLFIKKNKLLELLKTEGFFIENII